tara:strand:- start:40872 stop:41627 length:756 start_codon:yes stop_codon:yes gene_type:complete
MILRKLQARLLLAVLAVLSPLTLAGEALDAAAEAELRKVLEVPETGLKVQSIAPSEISGLYEVQFVGGPLIYSTADGSYFVLGDMFQVEEGGYINLAEKRRDGERAAQLDALSASDMITFSPEGKPKTHITVFTDVTCYYCQKLHLEVPELNAKGIEVRYLAYPRAGVDSDGFRQLASAWCADDRQTTITKLKDKQSVPQNVCAGNPVAEQYALGQSMGVRGTPAIVTEDGQMLPGYRSADELAELVLGKR